MSEERDIPAEVASALRRDQDLIAQIARALQKLRNEKAAKILGKDYQKEIDRKY